LEEQPEARTVLLPVTPADADADESSGPSEEPVPLSLVIPVGFDGATAVTPVAADEPRAVDPGMVLVELDEVKIKAQAEDGP
jgi:hypothetical protein